MLSAADLTEFAGAKDLDMSVRAAPPCSRATAATRLIRDSIATRAASHGVGNSLMRMRMPAAQDVKEDELMVLPGGGFAEDSDGTEGIVFSTPSLLKNMVEAAKAWGENKARVCACVRACASERVREGG